MNNDVSASDQSDLHLGNVTKASTLLEELLYKWATPVNQLAAKTIKALVDQVVDQTKSLLSQYGALFALLTLGPDVLTEYFLPHLSAYVDNLDSNLEQLESDRDNIRSEEKRKLLNTLRGTVQECARSMITAQVTGDCESDSEAYQMLYGHFGSGLASAPVVPGRVPKLPEKETVGKLRIRKMGSLRHVTPKKKNGTSNVVPSSSLSKSEFDFLSGVPENIFEPMDTSVESDGQGSGRVMAKFDMTPRKISDAVRNNFEIKGSTSLARKSVSLKYGNPKSKEQLRGRKFMTEMKAFAGGNANGCIGRRMAFPLSTERHKTMRLHSCYSLVSTSL